MINEAKQNPGTRELAPDPDGQQQEINRKVAKTRPFDINPAKKKKDRFKPIIRKRIKEVNELAIIAAIKPQVDQMILNKTPDLTLKALNCLLLCNEVCRLNNDIFTLKQVVKASTLEYTANYISFQELKKSGFIVEIKKKNYALSVKGRLLITYYNRIIGNYLDRGVVAYL